MTQGFLGMSNDDFWRDPEAGIDEAMKSFESGARIALDGPTELSLATRSTLPLAGLRAASVNDNLELDLRRMGVVVATWLDSGETQVGQAFYVRNPARHQPDPNEADEVDGDVQHDQYPEATIVDGFSLELCDRLRALTLRPGTLVTRVLVHDQASNPVVTRVAHHTTRDPEVIAFLARKSVPVFPPRVRPRPSREPYVDYEQEAHSPEPPTDLGVNLRIDRIVVRERVSRVMLRAAFRLEAERRDRVKPRPENWVEKTPSDESGASWRDVGYERATAVLPLTIIALGDQTPDPAVISLQVPVRSPVDPDADSAVVRGHFNLDLRAVSGEIRRPQTYAIWVLHRARLAGPAKMALVSEDMLPPG